MTSILNGFIALTSLLTGILLFCYMTVKSLKEGKARTRYGDFYRQYNPIGFWAYVIAGITVSLLCCYIAILVMLHPIKM